MNSPRPLVALVTGAAGGIGGALVKALLARGDRVLATDVADLTGLAAGAPEDRLIVRSFDVCDPESWQEAIALVVARWGRLDLLCNIAGYLRPGYLHEVEAAQIARHLDVNAKGVMLGTWAAARAMVPQGSGHIVNMASLAALAPVPGLSLYSASKFAVRGFSLAVAAELKAHGVAVTVVCPDAVRTPMLDLQIARPEAALTFSGSILGPEEIANLIVGRILDNRPLEVAVPAYRGWLAKVAGALPALIGVLGPRLEQRGRAIQAQLRER